MKFCIPHPADRLDLSSLERYSNVSEVYLKGPTGKIGSARTYAYNPSLSVLKDLCKMLHDKGYAVNIILNATCLGGEQFRESWVRKTLDILNLLSIMDVDVLTIADPYLIKIVRNYGFSFKIVVSVLSFIQTPLRAQYFDDMKVDRVTLPPDINRRFEVIEEIRRSVKCDLGVIVNEGCLPDCPYRYFCYNYMTHISVAKMNMPAEGNVDRMDDREIPPYYYFADNLMKITEPHLLLISPWIRPENLKDYEKLGIKYFKISGRAKPWAFLKNCLDAYHSQSFDGNFFELLDGMPRIQAGPNGNLRYGIPPYFISPPYFYVNNKDLEPLFQKMKNCSKHCKECGFCVQFAKEHITIDKVFREPQGIYRSLIESYGVYPWPSELPGISMDSF